MNRVSTEEVLNKAYRLAYFLHQDKGTATRIVATATLKLNVAMAAQSKRLYYIPVGRFSRGESRRTGGIRNKALFSNLHLLQRLIYVESEPYERQKERVPQVALPGGPAVGDPASEDDLLVYFIKHLVRITTKRNAFYVTLGVSRLLHSYSTLETMEIYNAVIGEPERVKDDYYYRSRKAVLMQELNRRFGQLIRACRGRRGEERFETQPGSNEQRSLVRECLRLFTPWNTQCPVPADFDPFKSVIASLISQSNADENRIEIKRIHAVLHPDCFGRLIAGFGYCPPETRMELPRFFADNHDDQSPPQQRSAPADLSSEDLAEINNMLAEQGRRRRRSSPTGVIRIMVDGVERGRLNPGEQSSVSFSAEEDAELFEVTTTDSSGDLLLATHLLANETDAHEGTTVYSIRLESGQDLSLSITRRPSNADGPPDLLIKFGYEETDPRRAVRLWWQRLNLRSRPARDPDAESLWVAPRLILAGSVLVLCVMGYLGYVVLRSRQTSQPAEITRVLPTPQTQDNSIPVTPAVPTDSPKSASPPAQRTRNDRSTVKVPTADNAEDVTRSSDVVANLQLKEVKNVYIDVRGDAGFDELRSNLIASLSSSGVVAVTTNADEADSSLKIVLSQTSGGAPRIEARLVNARGTVLWSRTGTRRYSGATAGVVAELVKDLSAEIRRARALP
ncbi:MAG TPA: hypothetical protein VFS76_20410 [Pyrinomonadaceae bacterium]|nr:hypothetical protein [Pyrinomonadaceae bacterium]